MCGALSMCNAFRPRAVHMEVLFARPPFRRSFPSDFGPTLRRHRRRASFAAPAPKLCRRRFDRIGIVAFLVGRDPHDLDEVADDVGGALLASWSLGHARSLVCFPLSIWERKARRDSPVKAGQFQTETLPVRDTALTRCEQKEYKCGSPGDRLQDHTGMVGACRVREFVPKLPDICLLSAPTFWRNPRISAGKRAAVACYFPVLSGSEDTIFGHSGGVFAHWLMRAALIWGRLTPMFRQQ